MSDLKLIALDAEDLDVVSATTQDAIVRVGDMAFARGDRRFALMMNRFAQIADYRPGSEADKQLKAELAHWGPVIKASGFTPAQ